MILLKVYSSPKPLFLLFSLRSRLIGARSCAGIKGKKLNSPYAFSVDSGTVTPRNDKGHLTSKIDFVAQYGLPLSAHSIKLFRTSRDFETPPPRKRKIPPANEADSLGEEALAPPPKKKSLNSRLVKAAPESAQSIFLPNSYPLSPLRSRLIGGPSRAYGEVKEVNDFEESPPGHSQLGHPAKDKKHSANKPDSKSEDVTFVTTKQKAQDTRVVKGLRDSAKGIFLSKFWLSSLSICSHSIGGPSLIKGKAKEARDPSESSSHDFEIAPPRKRKRHLANEADSLGEEALAPPPKKKSLNSRLVKGICESAHGISLSKSYSLSPLRSLSIGGPSRAYGEVKEVNDFKESPPRHSQIGHPGKDQKHSANKLDSNSEDVTLVTAKQEAQDVRVVKSSGNSVKGIFLSKF